MDDDDDRDRRKPDVRPPHVRAQTAKPVAGGVVRDEVPSEVTGNHVSIEQLEEWRTKRKTDARFKVLETKQDQTMQALANIGQAFQASAKLVERFDEKMDTIMGFQREADAERRRRIDMEIAAGIAAAKERAERRAWIIKVITAVGVAIAGIITAYVARR